jgi:hypothetical protein
MSMQNSSDTNLKQLSLSVPPSTKRRQCIWRLDKSCKWYWCKKLRRCGKETDDSDWVSYQAFITRLKKTSVSMNELNFFVSWVTINVYRTILHHQKIHRGECFLGISATLDTPIPSLYLRRPSPIWSKREDKRQMMHCKWFLWPKLSTY